MQGKPIESSFNPELSLVSSKRGVWIPSKAYRDDPQPRDHLAGVRSSTFLKRLQLLGGAGSMY